jgi:hypothetical protein
MLVLSLPIPLKFISVSKYFLRIHSIDALTIQMCVNIFFLGGLHSGREGLRNNQALVE